MLRLVPALAALAAVLLAADRHIDWIALQRPLAHVTFPLIHTLK
ncbi:Uncharacterised protein [Bordetella pertussis]|nr:Uncharacterised protein [Bordetella pertussis]